MRGKKQGILGSTLKVVGLLKGLIRVTYNKAEEFFDPELIKSLMKPKGYKIRLYVLRGVGLAAMDLGIWLLEAIRLFS